MRVTVADGKAVNSAGEHYLEGETLDADDREAAKWLERQLVIPAKVPAKKAAKTK